MSRGPASNQRILAIVPDEEWLTDLRRILRGLGHPVLGDRVDRWPGLAVDLIALFGTVCGVATSIGISAGGMNATLGSLTGLQVSVPNQIAIVVMVCVLGILSADSRGASAVSPR